MLRTYIADIALPSCLYNASGARCVTAAELDALAESAAGAILSKSCTPTYRAGNPLPRYYENEWGSFNSMGLPNEGYKYYAKYAAVRPHRDKPYFVSVSGLSLDDNLMMIEALGKTPSVDAIELNLSCPNVPGKPQTGYDMEHTNETLRQVAPLCLNKVWGVKLPPYFDIAHFNETAAILNQYPIHFVTCINSIGNALVIDPYSEQVVIKPRNGFGGLGGDYIKPTALANVRQFYTLLRPDIAIIGCGGVRTGIDAFEHILCGASAVQVGTALVREGTACFSRIEAELKTLMQQKGYYCIDDFKGKLKEL
ncbi:MAG: dihydroorotate oxidase [Chitinophagales bacterium]|nr:dihydroorotate oxidase [Chitinophagales bacterium]